MKNKTKLLILTDWYLPAQKAGGPIKSIANLVVLLRESFDLYIYTSNREFEESKSVLQVKSDTWVAHEMYSVFYSSHGNLNVSQLIKEVNRLRPDTIYVNSMFSARFSLWPLLLYRLGWLKTKKFMVAPRGMLQEGALRLKKTKKVVVLSVLRILGVYRRVQFHATDDIEAEDIKARLQVKASQVLKVANIPSVVNHFEPRQKEANQLRLVFLARVSKKKNIAFALESLNLVSDKNNIHFDVYGPQEEGYWNTLQHQISLLSDHVAVNYHGPLAFDEVPQVLNKYDAYILPTLGENFGHSIFEAFAAGLPVIISDQTPWRNLQASQAGFDLPLANPKLFAEAIEFFAAMDEAEFATWRTGAKQVAEDFLDQQNFLEEYTALFQVKQKVGFISPLPISRYKGGISVMTDNIFKHQAEFELADVALVHINTCQIARSNSSTGKLNWVNIKNLFRFLDTAVKTTRNERLTLLHINSSVGYSLLKDQLVASWLRLTTRAQCILHIHSADFQSIFSNKILFLFFRYIGAHFFQKILVLSNGLKQDLTERGIDEHKIEVLPNFHALQFNRRQVKANAILKLTFMGSIEKEKGIEELLQALHLLEVNHWELQVAGDFKKAGYKEKLEAQIVDSDIKEKISFIGYVNHEKRDDLLRETDIFILPSHTEGMPLSVLESAFFSSAVVLTDVGANNEYFSGICNLVPPKDALSLKEEIAALLSDEELLLQRKNQAKRLSDNFTFAAYQKEIIPIYKNI